MKSMVIKKDDIKLNIDLIGSFKETNLNKEFVVYSIMDDNTDNERCNLLIGELITDGEEKQIVGIKEEDKGLVLARYNELILNMGGE